MSHMDRGQIYGVNVVTSEAIAPGTAFAVSAPPARLLFASEAAYQEALDRWRRGGIVRLTSLT